MAGLTRNEQGKHREKQAVAFPNILGTKYADTRHIQTVSAGLPTNTDPPSLRGEAGVAWSLRPQ